MNYRLPYRMRRRTLLRGLLTAGAYSATSQFWTACSSPTAGTLVSDQGNVDDRPITIGFVYEGAKDDFGYSQSHAEAAVEIAAQFPGMRIVEEARIPETTAVQETIRNMIEQDGATTIFATSYGYFDPYVLKLAIEFPQVQFFGPNQSFSEDAPPNVGTYFCYLTEPAFLTGMVAASMSQTRRLGLVVPKLIPAVILDVNSFVLGARSVDPAMTARTVVTGDWNLPIKEAAATNSLIDQNADVILPRVDNAKVVANIAQNRGVCYCGFHVNQAELAPENFLTGVEWNWKTIYSHYANLIQAGNTLMNGGIPRTLTGGLKENFSKISPYGDKIPADVQTRIAIARAQLMRGELTVFSGGLNDNQGNLMISEGDAIAIGDPRLDAIDWFVEGVETN